jgi:GMP synthase-like glutamine amidotransferase
VAVYSTHTDIVAKAASIFIQLAWNEQTMYQATRFDKFLYTVQFHPEFNRRIMNFYLQRNQEVLIRQHLSNPFHVPDFDQLHKKNRQLRNSALILQNFIKIVQNNI